MSDPAIDLLVAHGYKYNPEAGSWSKEGEKPAPVQEPVATLFGSLPVYDTTPPAAQPDYAWPTIADYEKEVGFEVNDAFKAAWTMARTTNDLFKQMGGTK
jgi:hypothetical protein